MGPAVQKRPGRRAALVALAAMGAVAAVLWAAADRPAKVTGDTPSARVASICRVADERPSGAGEAIAAAAADPDPTVRRAAMGALGTLAEPQFRRTIETGLADSDPSVQAAAVASLGAYRDDPAAERLAGLLETEPRQDVRLAALLGLGRHGGPAALRSILRAAETDADGEVRTRALTLLAEKTGLTLRTVPPPDSAAFASLLQFVRRGVEGQAAGRPTERRATP